MVDTLLGPTSTQAAQDQADTQSVSASYAAWHGRLDGWRERAAQRAALMRERDADHAAIERLREEARERRELDEKRRIEAQARMEQQRREAVEYSAWRESVVLTRRADERARAAEHVEWRGRVVKLQRGVASTLASGSLAMVKIPSLKVPSPPPRIALASVVDEAGSESRAREPNGVGVDNVISEEDRFRLSEEEVWRVAVQQNSRALATERTQRAEQAKRAERAEFTLKT